MHYIRRIGSPLASNRTLTCSVWPAGLGGGFDINALLQHFIEVQLFWLTCSYKASGFDLSTDSWKWDSQRAVEEHNGQPMVKR